MLDKPTRWSYSSLSTYEECPAKWRYEYIDGIRTPPSPAMERGTMLHSMCEKVLNGEIETPGELAQIGRVLERLKANEAKPERAWRLDSEWKPVDSGSWVIGIIDVHFFKDGALHVYDFKSGRSYPSHSKQLELYSLIGLCTFPEAQRAEVGAIYIDTGKLQRRRTIDRAEAPALLANWTGRARKMFADNDLLPTPGSGCYWCQHKDSMGGQCAVWRKSA
jgi:hypothetical protein